MNLSSSFCKFRSIPLLLRHRTKYAFPPLMKIGMAQWENSWPYVPFSLTLLLWFIGSTNHANWTKFTKVIRIVRFKNQSYKCNIRAFWKGVEWPKFFHHGINIIFNHFPVPMHPLWTWNWSHLAPMPFKSYKRQRPHQFSYREMSSMSILAWWVESFLKPIPSCDFESC